MQRQQWWTLAGVAALSAAAGYVAAPTASRSQAAAEERVRLAPRLEAPAAPSRAPQAGPPTIAVAGDGNVTLHVEQQPLDWVLEQIAAQLGVARLALPAPSPSTVATAAAAAVRAAQATCIEGVAPSTDAQRESLRQAIERGNETERLDGLVQAREAGLTLSDETLKTLYETDASDRVRQLAFESYLERHSGHADTVRNALQAALHVPDAAIQNEARRLLELQQELARLDAASGQVSSP